MIIECPKCKNRHSMKTPKNRDFHAKIKCAKCSHKFAYSNGAVISLKEMLEEEEEAHSHVEVKPSEPPPESRPVMASDQNSVHPKKRSSPFSKATSRIKKATLPSVEKIEPMVQEATTPPEEEKPVVKPEPKEEPEPQMKKSPEPVKPEIETVKEEAQVDPQAEATAVPVQPRVSAPVKEVKNGEVLPPIDVVKEQVFVEADIRPEESAVEVEQVVVEAEQVAVEVEQVAVEVEAKPSGKGKRIALAGFAFVVVLLGSGAAIYFSGMLGQ
jgi:hypothetical protein